MSMDNSFDKVLKQMDFEFFAKGRHRITPDELFEKKDFILLDVRSKEEFDSINFPLKSTGGRVIHIPLNDIPHRYKELPKVNPIGIFCSQGIRAAIAYIYLKVRGFDNVRILMGGYPALLEQLMPGKLMKRITER